MKSHACTSETDTAKGSTMMSPWSEDILQAGQPGAWVLSSQQQRGLLLFLKGQPQVLGVAQILISLTVLCLGLILTIPPFTSLMENITRFFITGIGYHFWGSLSFFLSGVLTVAAGKKMTKGLIQGSLGMNAISAIVAGFGSFILIWEEMEIFQAIILYNHNVISFAGGVFTGMLVLVLLEACIALSLSIFGCRVACSVNKVIVYLPNNDNALSLVSPEHIYDELEFQ